jgi:predicted RNA-binding protein with PUA domain
MSIRDAARARWRADLHEYGAAALRIGGLNDMAVANDAEAASLRAYAVLMEELAAAKAAGDPVVLRAKKLEVVAFREARRSSNVIRPVTMDNIAEPSDDDLIALGY